MKPPEKMVCMPGTTRSVKTCVFQEVYIMGMVIRK
jgi:hypothetical protein